MTNRQRKFIKKITNNKVINFIIFSPIFDYIQWDLNRFIKNEAKKMKNSESIIDIGAGEMKYKKYFIHCKYTSNDLCIGDSNWDYNKIDIKSSAYNIPVLNDSYDNILCIQVLEHLNNPYKAFQEFYRILKPGGKLILAAPLGYEEHQIPHDYFRFTKYGLKELGNTNNLKLINIKPSGGIFINLEYMFWKSIQTLIPFRNILFIKYSFYVLQKPFKLLTGLIANIFNLFDIKKNYTLNYHCIYEKRKM